MSFPRYEAYKDSGVEWLGEVPTHWAVISLQSVASRQSRWSNYVEKRSRELVDFRSLVAMASVDITKITNHDGEYILIGRQGAPLWHVNQRLGKSFGPRSTQ